MAETKTLPIKAEDVSLEAIEVISVPSPSFKGRLNLSSFAFDASATQTLRRSPRSLTPKVEASNPALTTIPKLEPSNSPSPSSTPSRKRGTDTLSLPSSSSSSPSKRPRTPAGYAPPSKYAHLNELVDILEPGLICVFIGLNPGVRTATEGHAYSHPSNRFWKLLYSSGLTSRLMKPAEDRSLPELYRLGNTNIVARPTRNGAELSKDEMDGSVQALEEKMRQCKPEAVCIVGKSIWESIWRVRHGRAIKKEEFRYGWQDDSEVIGKPEGVKEEEGTDGETWKGAKVFVATSTSGLAATPTQAEKERIWRELGVWAEKRRGEKAEAVKIEVVGGAPELLN
ncbi:uracil DNA N-glycosylase Thp1 [Pseudogymnoascus australis]